MQIRSGGLDDPRVVELLSSHLARAEAETAPGSNHVLDLSGLRTPDIRFWTVWDGANVLGCGALKRLDAAHGEVKSMYTAEAARRRGVAGMMLGHILDEARASGFSRLSLQTGAWPYFQPARDLYAKHGFASCGVFAGYGPDPHSVFMTMLLEGPRSGRTRG